jgi:hypothetical protein
MTLPLSNAEYSNAQVGGYLFTWYNIKCINTQRCCPYWLYQEVSPPHPPWILPVMEGEAVHIMGLCQFPRCFAVPVVRLSGWTDVGQELSKGMLHRRPWRDLALHPFDHNMVISLPKHSSEMAVNYDQYQEQYFQLAASKGLRNGSVQSGWVLRTMDLTSSQCVGVSFKTRDAWHISTHQWECQLGNAWIRSVIRPAKQPGTIWRLAYQFYNGSNEHGVVQLQM